MINSTYTVEHQFKISKKLIFFLFTKQHLPSKELSLSLLMLAIKDALASALTSALYNVFEKLGLSYVYKQCCKYLRMVLFALIGIMTFFTTLMIQTAIINWRYLVIPSIVTLVTVVFVRYTMDVPDEKTPAPPAVASANAFSTAADAISKRKEVSTEDKKVAGVLKTAADNILKHLEQQSPKDLVIEDDWTFVQ